ncbi:hypothetical protein [Thermococcus sp.]|uniref:hypothetical protein n=1 Tax=Thermococcus sp. TaxID=35749 RepID=UPI002629D1A9|nr:hypothetical protein [Thermococcus sp.]
MRRHERFSLGVLALASVSPGFSLAYHFNGVSSAIAGKFGLYVPPEVISTVILFAFSVYLHRVKGVSLPMVVIGLAVLYVLPYLGGVPLEEVPFVTLSAIPLGVSIVFVPYAHSLQSRMESLGRGYPQEELENLMERELKIIFLSMLPGAMLLVYLLYSTSLGRNPIGLFPTYLTVIFALLIGVIISALEREEGTASKTVLVFRTYMTVGDSFRVKEGSIWENGFEIILEGGSPVKRTVLLSFPSDNVPEYVVIRSPWDSKFLTKKKESVENGARYVVFSTSRAPSFPDSASAPP